MKTFGGNRDRADVRRAVRQNGWLWNDARYRTVGSDWTTFGFKFGAREFFVVWASRDGCFIVESEGKVVSERSADMEGVPWFDALLDFLYLPATVNVDWAKLKIGRS